MCFSQKSESLISLIVVRDGLASKKKISFSSSSPAQAPLRGPVRPAIYLMAYASLVFPSKPFSMPQPECSFKITHLFLSLLHLNCFPLYFDDVQNAHMTCRAFLSGPCMAQGSCHPSPHPPCPDSPARLAFFVSAPRGFPLHLERWFSLSYSSPTSLLSLSSISSL